MSYNVRDSNILVGPTSGVELPNGAGASTVVAHQVMEEVGIFGQDAATFSASRNYCVFIAPPNPSAATAIKPLGSLYQVLGVSVFYHTAANGAATIAIEICPAGTADGSGANVLSASTYALNTALTANTPSNLALNASVDNLQIAPNGRINVITGGTATTGLVDFTLAIYVARVA